MRIFFNLKKRRSLSDYYDTDLDDDLEMATSTVYESSTEIPSHKLNFSPTAKPAKIESEIPSNGARNVVPTSQERVLNFCFRFLKNLNILTRNFFRVIFYKITYNLWPFHLFSRYAAVCWQSVVYYLMFDPCGNFWYPVVESHRVTKTLFLTI